MFKFLARRINFHLVSACECDFFFQQAPVQTRGRAEEQTEEEEGARNRGSKESKNGWTADKFWQDLKLSVRIHGWRDVYSLQDVNDFLYYVSKADKKPYY